MSPRQLRALFTAGALCLVAFGIAAYISTKSNSSEAAIARIQSCIKQVSQVTCTREDIRALLKTHTGSEVMDMLVPALSPLGCHYVGHVVGEELFVAFRSVESGFASCNYACDAGCLHGVVGEAFAEQLGYKYPQEAGKIDLAHLSTEELTRVGKRLCKDAETCHGIGHVLFQAYGNLRPTFATCKKIASKEGCFNGASMEYLDTFLRTAEETGEVLNMNINTLKMKCDVVGVVEKRACLRYLPKIVESVLTLQGRSKQESFKGVKEFCESFSSQNDAASCFVGMSLPGSSRILERDPHNAVEFCRQFKTLDNQKACVLGMASVATSQRKGEILSFCGALSEEPLEKICYSGFFYHLGSDKDAPRLCNRKAECLYAAQNFKRDPWMEFEKSSIDAF